MTPRFLFIPILLSSALANAVEVSFLNPTDVAAASPRVAQVQRFADQPCELSWRITATAGEEVQVTGKVFLLATSLAAPMSALDFEVKAQVPAGAAGTEVKHLFKPEDAAGERQYLVKWQAAGSIGSILIGISQRGILAGLQQVSTNGAPELAELTQALQKEGVQVTEAAGDASLKGLKICYLKAKELPSLLAQPLLAGQYVLSFGQLAPGLPEVAICKPLGEGHLILLPQSYLQRLPHDPAIQRLILTFVR